MQLLSVNVGRPRTVSYADRRGRRRTAETGIFKTPVSGPVMARRTNLDGDGQADLQAHGGIDKAVYAYTRENYRYWEDRLGRADFTPGQFGENLTVAELTDDRVRIGDRYRVGAAMLEVSQPRYPCFKLAVRMEHPEFDKAFARALRTGFYLRVLEEGTLAAGDAIERVYTDPESWTVEAVMRLRIDDNPDKAALRAAAALPALSAEWRTDFARLADKP